MNDQNEIRTRVIIVFRFDLYVSCGPADGFGQLTTGTNSSSIASDDPLFFSPTLALTPSRKSRKACSAPSISFSPIPTCLMASATTAPVVVECCSRETVFFSRDCSLPPVDLTLLDEPRRECVCDLCPGESVSFAFPDAARAAAKPR